MKYTFIENKFKRFILEKQLFRGQIIYFFFKNIVDY